jgi:hypothetical protein
MDEITHIHSYLSTLPESKKSEMEELHKRILTLFPGCKLWFMDGKNNENKIVTNPNIGYGEYTITYADGKTRPFYKIGISSTSKGISVYLMGIENKNFLKESVGSRLGKAKISGYCISFKSLNEINLDVLDETVLHVISGSYHAK